MADVLHLRTACHLNVRQEGVAAPRVPKMQGSALAPCFGANMNDP